MSIHFDPISTLLGDAAGLASQRNFTPAIDILAQANLTYANDIRILSALANILVNARRPAESLPLYDTMMQLSPNDARIYNNRGLAYTDLGRFNEALLDFATALRIDPTFVPPYNNLANLYIMMGRHREALSSLDVALMLDSSHASALRNRGLAHLSLGDFAAGRDDYDRACNSFPDSPMPYPAWEGQPLAGRRLLLLTFRHGLGDTIQFIRFAPQLKALGAYVILQCAMPLAEVLQNVPGVDEVIVHGDALPPADFSQQLVSLLRVLKVTLESIPADVPYIAASLQKIATWKDRLATLRKPGHRLVGIAWQGNPHHQWDRFRSIPLERFMPLAQIPGVQLVSLQRGPGVEQIAAFQEATRNALLVPTTGAQTDPTHLADSAAIIANLDLLITIDTFTAHLAGAMGKPVCVALSTVCDWRWMTDRADTPWYPTMRLFRQKSLDDWAELFGRIASFVRAPE